MSSHSPFVETTIGECDDIYDRVAAALELDVPWLVHSSSEFISLLYEPELTVELPRVR